MQKQNVALSLLLVVALIASFIGCKDVLTYFLETFPVLLGWPALLYLDQKYKVTSLAIYFAFFHSLILILGAHYTYAEVPLGFWMQEWFGFARNHYDRIGHIAQGLFPAIFWREVYIRKAKFQRGAWLALAVVTGCLAFSAFYEFIEWWAALATGEGAHAFLGTQGDVWDTQWDMFLCFVGAIVSILAFSKLHEKQLAKIQAR